VFSEADFDVCLNIPFGAPARERAEEKDWIDTPNSSASSFAVLSGGRFTPSGLRDRNCSFLVASVMLSFQ
jgi:hypothetical protein